MERALEYFQALREVVKGNEVYMSGAWVGKPQRRYASPEQFGTGEGPFVDTVDWRWDGTFESTSPIAGIALLAVEQRLFWVKSEPPSARPELSFSLHGWAECPGSVSVTAAFHGVARRSLPIAIDDEPPTACVIGHPVATMGTPHLVARLDRVSFSVVLLPASAVKVGRNRLWRLRDALASKLPLDVQKLMTRGRTGEVAFSNPPRHP